MGLNNYQKPTKLRQALDYLQKQAIKYWIEDSNLHSYILYWVLFQTILGIKLANNWCSIFLIVSILLSILTKRNYFFVFGPLLNLGFSLSIVNYTFGLLAANQKSKLYLYLFFCAQLLTFYFSSGFVDIYRVIIAIFILKNIWSSFLFKGNQNKNWFCVFSTYALLMITKYILISIGYDPYIVLWLSPFSIFLGYLIFAGRQKQIFQNQQQASNSPQLAYFYIQLSKQKIQNPAYMALLFEEHKRQCTNILCTCHHEDQFSAQSKEVYIDNLYKEFLLGNNEEQWEYLYNRAIINKLNTKNVLQAIYMHLSLQPKIDNLFRKIERLRNQSLIVKIITKLDFILAHKNALTQALYLDKFFVIISRKIIQIVRMKIKFWKEVVKPVSSLSQMQHFGRKIIEDIQQLHNFYCTKAVKLEEYLNSFSITILYAMYIMSVTNYKQYADSLIKGVKRKFQIKLLQDPVTQIQAIMIKNKNIINEVNPALIQQKINKYLIDLGLKNTLLISNVSNSFCRLVQRHKQQLIGSNIEQLIPPIYRLTHYQAVENLFQSKYDNQSKVLGQTRQFPIYLGENQIILITMNIKILFDQNGEFVFLAIIEPVIRQFKLILTNFQGKNLSNEPFAEEKILKSKQVLNQLSLYKEQWLNNKTITPTVIFIHFQRVAYLIKFHAPSQIRYKQYQQNPPIHINVKNQTQSNQMNYIKDINENQVNYCFNRIKNVYSDQQTQATVRSNRVQSSICKYKSCQAAQLFKPLYLIQIIFIILCILTSNLQTFVAVSDQQVNGKSLIDNFEIMINIDQNFKDVQLLSYDYRAVMDGKISQQYVQYVYGDFDFKNLIVTTFDRSYKELNTLMNELILFQGATQIKVSSIMNRKLTINYNSLTYELTIKSIIKVSISDVFLLANNFSQNINKSTLQKIYYPKVQPQIKQIITSFKEDFYNNYLYLLIYNCSLEFAFIFVLAVLIIPTYKFKSKYYHNKLKIYQLLTSIDSKLIKVQINLLANVQYTLLQSRNSPQYVKTHSICRIGKTQRHLTMKQNENVINYKLQINQDGDNEMFQLRKKNGQISQNVNTNNSLRLIKVGLCWILFLIIMFCIVTFQKIYQNLNMHQIEQNIFNNYIELDLQQQLMLISKIIGNYEGDLNDQFVKKYYQKEISILEKLYSFEIPGFQSATIECNKQFKNAKICELPVNKEILNQLFLNLITNFLQSIKSKSKIEQNDQKIIFFAQSVLTKITQASLNNINKLIKQKKQITADLNQLVTACYIIEWVWIIITVIYGVFANLQIVKNYINETKIILLVNQQMYLKTKVIQSFLDKLSSK